MWHYLSERWVSDEFRLFGLYNLTMPRGPSDFASGASSAMQAGETSMGAGIAPQTRANAWERSIGRLRKEQAQREALGAHGVASAMPAVEADVRATLLRCGCGP